LGSRAISIVDLEERARSQRWFMVSLLLTLINAQMVFDRVALIVTEVILQAKLHLALRTKPHIQLPAETISTKNSSGRVDDTTLSARPASSGEG